MSTNEQLIQKADLAVADLTSNGGLLNPEQANTFIRKLLIQPVLTSRVRRVVMNSPERKVNKIQFNKRIMRLAASATALDTAAQDGAFDASAEATARAKPITEQITLNTDEFIAEVNLPYDVIEDNIERGNIGTMTGGSGDMTGGLRDTIMTLIAERAALDLEEWALLADTSLSATDPYLGSTDGYLKRATSNIVDAGGAPISRRILTDGMKTLPKQYRRDRTKLTHWLGSDQEIDYRETIAQRETSMGDSQLQSTSTVYGAGAPVTPVGLMPEASGLLAHPLNLLFGIQRQIHVETDKDIRTREYIIVLTLRAALQIEEELALVKYTNIGT